MIPSIRPIVLSLLALCCLLLAPARTDAASTAHIVVDAHQGTVLSVSDGDRPWFPASLAKVMTAYLVLRAVEAGTLTLDDTLTVSKAAASQPERKAHLAAGKSLSARTALLATLVHSANDAAVVLAEAVAGSEAAFVVRMNETAAELGMAATRFANASGLPDPHARITARDAALLARALMRRFPDHMAMFARRTVDLDRHRLATTNGLLDIVPGATGMKTGFTCWSGYNVILTAERDGRSLITVVLGGTSSAERNREAANLTAAAFRTAPEALGEPLATLDDIVPAAASATPPEVLTSQACGSVAIGGGVDPRLGGAQLPGWGALFGSFPTTAQARARIADNLKLLPAAQRLGQPTIVPSTRRPILMHSALLTGLNQDTVLAICGSLQAQDIFCQGLPPRILNEPLAIWR